MSDVLSNKILSENFFNGLLDEKSLHVDFGLFPLILRGYNLSDQLS